MMTTTTKTRTKRAKTEFLEEPGTPGPVPFPDHHTDIPAAPATHPPEAPIVPSDSAIGEFIQSYGPALLLIGAGLIIALLILSSFEF